MANEFTITYLNTENVRNPVSTFQVVGRKNGLPVNETVQLDRATLITFTGKTFDVLGFLKEVDAMRQDLAATKYRKLLIDMACEQTAGVFETFETYRLMLSLAKKEPKKQAPKGVTVYDRFGRTHTYKTEQPRINVAF